MGRIASPLFVVVKTLPLQLALTACAGQPPAAATSVGATICTTASSPPTPAPSVSASAAPVPGPPPIVRQPAGLVALQHVLLFDGTLAPPKSDQTVLLDHGKITSVVPSSSFVAPPGATVLDLTGRAVLPGLVGMHNHLYYIDQAGSPGEDSVTVLPELLYSAPRLYLAGGVTTIRTTGCIEPYADLNLRRQIDDGTVPGPELDVTAPYLEGPGGHYPQMPVVKTAAEARKFVDFWADAGATSIKAYTSISPDALRAGIQQAHRRGMKVTGHLCSVTYREAAEMGIDNLEHGFFASTDFDKDKPTDACRSGMSSTLELNPDSAPVRDLIRVLVSHHVAITSTLPVFEQAVPGRSADPRAIALLAPTFQARYLKSRASIDVAPWGPDVANEYRNDLKLERAFVAAGGLLLAGPDPNGNGGILPGFGDQREVELLVEAGFSPVEAIHIATSNGAQYLGRLDRIGTVAAGKQADLVIVRGDPGANIKDIENVEIVFKKGVGYDPAALIERTRGTVGLY